MKPPVSAVLLLALSVLPAVAAPAPVVWPGLATPFGEAGPGETAFWDAPAWNKLMENATRWLVRHE